METTINYFKLNIEELLKDGSVNGTTKEESLLMNLGSSVIFYDNISDLLENKYEFAGEKVKMTLKTINERLAVVIQ